MFNYRGFLYKEIKSAVKVGIKNGLGIKYINSIAEGDIVRVVKELIKADLNNTNEKNIQADCLNIQKKIEEYEKEREKLFVTHNALCEKRKAIIDNSNRKDLNKEQQKKANSQIISSKLPNLLDKIKEEVTKALIVDGLKDK